MLDFMSLDKDIYFILQDNIKVQFHKLEATVNGVKLFVKSNGRVESISASEIEYIVIANNPAYFNLANDFISFLQKDLTSSPLLLKFIFALWNGDYSNVDLYLQEDELLSRKFLGYMQEIAKLQDYNNMLSNIFSNYVQHKKPIRAH